MEDVTGRPGRGYGESDGGRPGRVDGESDGGSQRRCDGGSQRRCNGGSQGGVTEGLRELGRVMKGVREG